MLVSGGYVWDAGDHQDGNPWKSPINPFICHCWRGGCSGNGFTTAPLKIFGWCHTSEENDICFICHVQINSCLSQWGYSGMAIYFETVWKYRNSASFWRLNLWLLAAQLLLEKNNRKTKSWELEKKTPQFGKTKLETNTYKITNQHSFQDILGFQFSSVKKNPCLSAAASAASSPSLIASWNAETLRFFRFFSSLTSAHG